MKAPNTQNLMPGEATRVLVAFFVQRFIEAPLNCYGRSSFSLVNAFERIDESDEWARQNTPKCFSLAEKEYEDKHYKPKMPKF